MGKSPSSSLLKGNCNSPASGQPARFAVRGRVPARGHDFPARFPPPTAQDEVPHRDVAPERYARPTPSLAHFLGFRRRRQETDNPLGFACAQCTRTENCASRSCTSRARTSTGTRTPERGGCPSTRSSRSCVSLSFFFLKLLTTFKRLKMDRTYPRYFVPTRQLISVISLLSQDTPDINSPANVDAAVRLSLASLPST